MHWIISGEGTLTMMTTLDWIANKFDRIDFNDLNEFEAEIARRLIDEGYLYEEQVLKKYETILYYELVYCPT